jgi:hypothetical protein
MTSRRCAVLAGLVALAPLAGCHPPPPPSPILSLYGMPCGAQPDFIGAPHLALDPDKKVTVDLQGTLPCFQTPDGVEATYAAFALPESPSEYLVSVASVQRGMALLPPHALVYDGLGHYLREVSKDAFQFHGSSLRAAIRIHPGERYVVVASADPQVTIGQSLNQIVDGVGVSTWSLALPRVVVTTQTHYGTETENTITFSYNGQVTASAFAMPTAR